jgi:hypothetical protein
MLINNNPTQWQQIGRWVQGVSPINDKRDMRGDRFICADAGMPSTGRYKWLIKTKGAAAYIGGRALNNNRDFDTPFLDVVVEFNAKVADASLNIGDVATGHIIKLNGSAQTTTYRSGSGTGRWVLRIPVVVDAVDTLMYSYDGSGNTTDVFNGVEISTVTDQKVNNLLTKKIRFYLKKSDNTVDASETVKLAICTYSTETLINDPWDIWMNRQQQQTVTTDANGLVDIDYVAGVNTVGDNVYVIILRPDSAPTESLIWTTTVQ